MTVIQLLREKQARREAIFSYAEIHDRWSEREQMLVASGETDDAQLAHECALVALRAYRAELDDPEPAPRRQPSYDTETRLLRAQDGLYGDDVEAEG